MNEKLKDLIATYRRLHSREGIWPEILQGIREVGILEMEIYLLGDAAVYDCGDAAGTGVGRGDVTFGHIA